MPHYTYLNQFSHILYIINLVLSLYGSIECLSSSLASATITWPFTTTTILPLLIALSFGHLVPILVRFDTHRHTSVQPQFNSVLFATRFSNPHVLATYQQALCLRTCIKTIHSRYIILEPTTRGFQSQK